MFFLFVVILQIYDYFLKLPNFFALFFAIFSIFLCVQRYSAEYLDCQASIKSVQVFTPER